jgi:hypothetical protein
MHRYRRSSPQGKLEAMNPRHTAALALVGWYLLAAPSQYKTSWSCQGGFTGWLNADWFGKEDHKKYCDSLSHVLDVEAPLSKWTIDGSYDTARECDARYHQDLDLALDMKRNHLSPPNLFDEVQAEQCIATDDPRLKGN